LVVRTCGYLEVVVDECSKALIESKSAPRVAAFATSWLERGRNPRPSTLVEIARKFDSQWGDELSDLLNKDDELLKRELSLLVDKRNKIAHGKGEGITARKALDLIPPVFVVADWFIDRFDPR
jgi:hypothetical protein